MWGGTEKKVGRYAVISTIAACRFGLVGRLRVSKRELWSGISTQHEGKRAR